MLKFKKQHPFGVKRARRASTLLAGLVLSFSIPAIAFASDAGAVAEIEVAPALAETPEPTVVPAAAPSATRTSLDKLSSEILNIIIPTLVAIIGALATMLLGWINKKAKLDVSDKQISQWSMVAELAAGRAGEWGRNKLKTLTEGQTIPGPEILEVGVNWTIDYGVAHGLPGMGRKKLEGLIESKLHSRRIELMLQKMSAADREIAGV